MQIYEDRNTLLESNASNLADEICGFDQCPKGQYSIMPPLSISHYKNVDKENSSLPGANTQGLASGFKGLGDVIQEEMSSRSTFMQQYAASRDASDEATCIDIDSNMPDTLHVTDDSSEFCRMEGVSCSTKANHWDLCTIHSCICSETNIAHL